jgi:hypothetical protein
MPRIRSEIARATNVILESNSVLRFLRPDLYLAVLDASVADFKASALRYLDRADAILLSNGDLTHPAWTGVSSRVIGGIPALKIPAPGYWSSDVEKFVRGRLVERNHPAAAV